MWYVDVSAAAHSRAGLGRYSENMARALAEARPGQVALFHNLGKGGKRPDSLRHLPTRQVNCGYKPWRMAGWLAHLSGISFARLFPVVTLFLSTQHPLIPLHTIPTVLTVHDLIFKLFPEHHKKLKAGNLAAEKHPHYQGLLAAVEAADLPGARAGMAAVLQADRHWMLQGPPGPRPD